MARYAGWMDDFGVPGPEKRERERSPLSRILLSHPGHPPLIIAVNNGSGLNFI
jgi:hypothetical protein